MSDYIIRCDQAAFERAFQQVALLVNSDSGVDQERYVMVDAQMDGVLTLRSVRAGVTQIKHEMPADIRKRDFFGLQAEQFSKRMRFLAGDFIDVSRLNENEVVFTGGGVHLNVKHLQVYAYPTDPTIDWKTKATLVAPDLARGIRIVSSLVSKDLRFITGAMRMCVTPETITLYAAAQLSGVTRFITPVQTEQTFEPFELFVPRTLLDVFSPIFTGKQLSILQDIKGNNVGFGWQGTVVSGQTMFGEWPAIDPLFTREAITWAVLPREPLLGILSLILVNNPSKDETALARLRFSDESIVIDDVTKNKHEDARADIRIDELHGKRARVTINARQIQGIIKDLNTKTIRIGLTERGFIRVDVPDSESFLHIASPINNSMEVEE